MPNRSEYQRLAQSVDDDIQEEDLGLHYPQPTSPNPALARKRGKRPQIDLRTIDSAFKKWTESIAQKVKRKKKTTVIEKQEIVHTVFGPEVPIPRHYSRAVRMHEQNDLCASLVFRMTESVRTAIADGIHPKMISKGSSGSYYARAKVGGRLQTVGVFKPKDEEPYGRLNPKTTKWIHRQFRWIIPFGRSCLIPNLSYISEAAASLLDERLQLYIVPRTELVTFSSPAFFYDWLDRNAAKKGKPLPGKIGSMQCFLNGFQDASEFLRKHPFPGRSISDTFDDSTHRTGGAMKRFLSAIQVVCGRTGDEDLNDDEDDEEERMYDGVERGEESTGARPFYWSTVLQQEFREELEKIVILGPYRHVGVSMLLTHFHKDFLMRNTDRGADNYMLKYCEGSHERSLIDIAPTRSTTSHMPVMRGLATTESPLSTPPPSVPHPPVPGGSSTSVDSRAAPYDWAPHVHLAAIDNSLAWPHEHPKGWRSFTYGWLYLPVSVIGRPFSEKTRCHILPLLTSKAWWEETTYQLRKLFALDPDFHPKMFRRQLAVMKGQAWNVVQCLKHSDEGPLELTRRQKVLVWDDEIEISDEDGWSEILDSGRSIITSEAVPQSAGGVIPARMQTSQRRVRSRSIGSFPFPPPMRRSTDGTGEPGTRPVPFAGKFRRINPGASGVTVLEHMERLDEVERGLKKLGMEEVVVVEEEEVEEDVGSMAKDKPLEEAGNGDLLDRDLGDGDLGQSEVLGSSPAAAHPVDQSDDETDHRMSMSDAQIERRHRTDHGRIASDRGVRFSIDWTRGRDGPQGFSEARKRTVIVERLETIDPKPFFSCW